MGSYAGRELQGAQFVNGETIQDALCISAPSTTYFISIGFTSSDPFTSKTNKYAESNLLRIYASVPFHIRMGTESGVGTAVNTDFMIPGGRPVLVKVDKDQPYMRIITNSGGGNFWVTEIY